MTGPQLQIALVNSTSSSTVYAYVTGSSITNGNKLVLLLSDGLGLYYPPSPDHVGTPIADDISIPLGPPGSTKTITIPWIAGGRLWFSIGKPLTFLLNPGPALVEPSVSNPSDPNINTYWDFAEFTFNSAQIFANISYVDFVSVPISLTLTSTSGPTQHVAGMAANGLATVVAGLNAQNAADGAGWNQLVVYSNGQPIRALSPNNGIVMNGNLFANYWTNYVNEVWNKYSSMPLTINTQAQYGNVNGQVANGTLNFPSGSYTKPSARDIFSCSTGPFANSDPEMLAITPRLAAAFNRSTLLMDNVQPDGASVNQYYTTNPTNHYSRIVHAANLDGRGYAFPYDDVTPDGGADQSGSVSSGNPVLLTVAVGGNGAHA